MVAKKKRVGFVGVGRMGANMARRLHECGHPISSVYDIDGDTAAVLADELGTIQSTTLEGVTAASDVVITVVTDDAAMGDIYKGRRDNLLKGKPGGRVFINCATISPKVHIEIEKLAAQRRAASLEGCMASSIPQARSGTLYLIVAGKRRTFDRVKPILDDLSTNMRYVGASGKAAEVKALVNMVMNINTAGLAEGLGLGAALGLDLTMLREIFSQTGANSRVLETDGEDMQIRDHECYFSGAHAAKDSGIAAALARKIRLHLPLNAATVSQYQRMIDQGLGELDKSGIAELTFKGRHRSRRRPSGRKN